MKLMKRIKYYRLENKLSQEELGKKIGADARTISNYETGKYKPSTDTAILLAKVFNISIDELLLGSQHDRQRELALEDKEWAVLFSKVAVLSEEDKGVIKNLLNYLLSKKKL